MRKTDAILRDPCRQVCAVSIPKNLASPDIKYNYSIEKACSEFIVKFRTIIDQGFLCDGDNKRVDFRSASILYDGDDTTSFLSLRNCIILMTTTVGSRHLASPGEAPDETRQLVLRDMRKTFPMDFLNRLDEIIIFVSVRLIPYNVQ